MRWLVGAVAMLASTGHLAAQSTPAHEERAAPTAWNLTGSIRQQYEHFTNEEWGDAPHDRDGYLLQRYMLRVERRWGSRVRAVVEIKTGIELGRVGGPRVPDEDLFDLHQGYVELRSGMMDLKVGRQELQFGSSRLVSVRDLNVRQSFDAARATLARRAWRIDAFGSWPVSTRSGALDDATDRTRRLWGVYAVRHSGRSGIGVDVYYLGYGRDAARFESVSGRERRHSIGTRLWGAATPIDYNVEAVGQWGAIQALRIRAWGVASDVGYRLPTAGRLRVGLRADVSSGDRDASDTMLGTFNGLFASAAYFGLIATAGPANHMDLQPQVALEVHRGMAVTVGWLVFWRREVADGLYTWSGRLLRSAAGTDATFVGQSPSVTLAWTVSPHLSISGDVAAFTAGPFIRESGGGRTSTFIRTTVAWRF
jgi:hypothetical protein